MKLQLMGASALVLTALTATASFAQTTAAPEAVETVVVTGTRTSGLKAVDSPAPVQVLGNDILKRVGQPDLVQSLAQNIPSLQAQVFGSDQAQFNKSFKLRGVSPNNTLVLINGERRHGTGNVNVAGGAFGGNAAADLNYVPVAAIDHVEVLQDGAAAQYGTDAIAGVVNIILKKNTHGGSLTATAGHYFDEGGLTTDVMGNIGWAPTDKSFLNVTLETKFQGHSFRGDFDPRVLNLNGSTPLPVAPKTPIIYPLPVGTAGGNAAGGVNGNVTASGSITKFPTMALFPDYPYSNRIGGDGQTQLDALFFNAGYELSPDVNLYSFGSAGYKDGRAYENYRLANVVTSAAGVPLFAAGFSPQENIRETDYSITIGAKGMYHDTTWNLASTYGRNYDRIYVLGSANAALYKDTGATPINFHDGDFTATELTNNLDISHSFNVGWAEPLTVAGGAEYRINSYELKAGDPASYYATSSAGGGAQSFFGYAPSNAGYHQRSNYAFYGDVSGSPITPLKLEAAIRYENYTDFGSATVYKGTVRYDFNDMVAVRATADTGFRAPTMAEQFYSGINVGPTSVSGVFAPGSAGAKFLGLSGLKPEKSVDFSAGLVTHFVPRLTMTLDAYALKITDRILQSGSFFGYNTTPRNDISPSVLTALTASGVPIDPNIFKVSSASVSVQSFVNGADSQTYGADFVATYPMDYGSWGHVDYSFSANYNDTKITKIAKPPSNVSPNAVILDQGSISTLEDTTPQFRGTFGAFWNLGRFSANLRESFYGSAYLWSQNAQTGVYTQILNKEAFITDLELSMQVIPSVKFTAGANNLFNTYPTKEPSAFRQAQFNTNSSGFASSVYPNFSAYGFNGGFYYGRVTYSF
jgi:iron complex outermembrane receptor protein